MNSYVILKDIPFSLVLEVEEEKVLPVIKKGTRLPVKVQNTLTTIQQHQAAVEIHILKGEGKTVKENETLTRLLLPGIKMAPAGCLRLEVVFYADIFGFLEVSVKECGSQVSLRTLLTEFSNKDISNVFCTNPALDRLKRRVVNLSGRLAAFSRQWRAVLDPQLCAEMDGLLYDCRVALIQNHTTHLQAGALFLETMLNELSALQNRRV